jgi:hypothetical protein
MPFTCPRCGGHEYKTEKTPDGRVERFCQGGKLTSEHRVVLGHAGTKVRRMTGSAVYKTKRECTYFWSAEDDVEHGVDESDGKQASP